METWILLTVIAVISIVSVLFYVFVLKPQNLKTENEITETKISDVPDHVCDYLSYHEQTNDFTIYYCSVCGEYMGTYHDYYDGDPRD